MPGPSAGTSAGCLDCCRLLLPASTSAGSCCLDFCWPLWPAPPASKGVGSTGSCCLDFCWPLWPAPSASKGLGSTGSLTSVWQRLSWMAQGLGSTGSLTSVWQRLSWMAQGSPASRTSKPAQLELVSTVSLTVTAVVNAGA